MSIFIFTGPTLSESEARAHLPDATYLPPVRQGDVARLLSRRPSVIGIIDGYFNHQPSVWHKELLLALQRGVRVFGAASMGALRAAELHPHGMVGVGEIYAAFEAGTLTDDDEVAVVHSPAEEGYLEQSDAMVNIRDRLRVACERELISATTAEALTAIAKGLFYRERSLRRTLELARAKGLDEGELAGFEGFLRDAGDSLKKRDAIQMLQRIAELEPGGASPQRPAVEHTFFLEQLLSEIDMERVGANAANPEVALAGGESLNVVRKKTLLRLLAVKHAEQLGIVATAEETQQMADDFRLAHGLGDADTMLAWLRDTGLTLERFSAAMGELATVRKLEQRYTREIDARVPDHVRLNSARPGSKLP